jgi:DNA-binding transcriptional regulator GbsR (MarR family)
MKKDILLLKFGRGAILMGRMNYCGIPTQTFHLSEKEYPVGELKEELPMSDYVPDLMMSFENIESLNVVIGSLEKLREHFKVKE